MPASQVGDPQAASRLFRLLTGHGSLLLMTDGAVGSEGDAGTEAKRRFWTVGPRSAVSREKMRLLLFSGLLNAAVCLPTGSAAACDQFTPFGQPVSSNLLEDVGVAAAPNRIVICHTGQVVAFNPERNVSDWVAYRLRREDLLNQTVERKDNFRSDLRVPEEHRVVHSDYTRTGYDRGHLAPAAAMRWSFEAMNDSFFMTNIAPQVGSGFNQHIWKSLERRMRQWACQRGVLYVVTGPLYERTPVERIAYDEDGDGKDDNGILVDVPTHFFKFAYDPHSAEAIAFILPNQKLKTRDPPLYLTSIDDIEARSRLDFLMGIWDGAERAVEAHVQVALWRKPEDEVCRKLQ